MGKEFEWLQQENTNYKLKLQGKNVCNNADLPSEVAKKLDVIETYFIATEDVAQES